MPWFEPIVLAALAGAALCMVFAAWRGAAAIATYVAAALLLLDFYYRGFAEQMVPAIPAAILLLLCLRWVRRGGNSALMGSYAALSLVSTSLGILILLPFFELPKPTGAFAVGTQTVHLYDRSRDLAGAQAKTSQDARELVVQLWYPIEDHSHRSRARYVRLDEISPVKRYMAGIRTNSWQDAPIAAKGGPFPVLLYGHSWGSRRGVDTFLCEELASHGFVVAAIDHPYNSARIELGDGHVLRGDRTGALDNVESSSAAAVEKIWADELERWVADQRFVLTQLQHSVQAPSLDFSRVGAFGHSFGGSAALAMLGLDSGDPAQAPAVKAGLNLDGWTFGALDRRTTQPVLIVYEAEPAPGSMEHEPGVEGVLDRTDIGAVLASMHRFGGVEVYVAGTSHLDFTDQTLVSPFQKITYTGPIKAERIRLITRELVLSFFEQSLRHQATPLPTFPEVTQRNFAETP